MPDKIRTEETCVAYLLYYKRVRTPYMHFWEPSVKYYAANLLQYSQPATKRKNIHDVVKFRRSRTSKQQKSACLFRFEPGASAPFPKRLVVEVSFGDHVRICQPQWGIGEEEASMSSSSSIATKKGSSGAMIQDTEKYSRQTSHAMVGREEGVVKSRT